MMVRAVTTLILGLSLLAASSLHARETITHGRNLSADIAADGRVVMDLVGDLWVVPPSGGNAIAITRNLKSVQRPRWSPDVSQIAYQAISAGSQGLWIYDVATDQSRNISRNTFLDLHPAWHPDGERLVYASDSTGRGFDLWEVDLPTGLHWRISNRTGDETEPAWSSDGRDLVYIHRQGNLWSLVLRRHGLPEEILLSTPDRLAGPSWRPDGSLITFLRKGTSASTIEMVILSQPRLIRPYGRDENFELAPVSWFDRERMIYTSNGFIRQRHFDSWTSSPFPFEATIEADDRELPAIVERQQLPRIDEPVGRLIIHASRMFDGIGGGYHTNTDIIIDEGRITAVEPHSERTESLVIDLGDITVLPGFIDAHAALSPELDDNFGALLLTTGVTTVVAQHTDAERLNTLWSGNQLPGPRLLSKSDWGVSNVSGIADSMTPGLSDLLQSRQARIIGVSAPVARRFADYPRVAAGVSSVVAGSNDNGLPAGIALHAELRALSAAGLTAEQSLRAAGVNAAAALGLDPALGRIAVGAAADLVFVDGDPLGDVRDALNVIAVLRNGRFFSVSGLLERTQISESVDYFDKTPKN